MEARPAFAAFVSLDRDGRAADAVEAGTEFAAAAPPAATDDDPGEAEIVAILHADDIEAAALAALGVETLEEHKARVEVPVTGAGRVTD